MSIAANGRLREAPDRNLALELVRVTDVAPYVEGTRRLD